MHKACGLKVTQQTYISLGVACHSLTFQLLSKNLFKSKMVECTKFANLFTTSNAEPDYDSIVFIFEPVVKNFIVW